MVVIYTLPVVFQVAEPEERAEPYRPNATVIYTGESKTAASEIASLLLSSTNAGTPPSANSTALAAAYLNRSSPENPIEASFPRSGRYHASIGAWYEVRHARNAVECSPAGVSTWAGRNMHACGCTRSACHTNST